jgi:hypothetical protein
MKRLANLLLLVLVLFPGTAHSAVLTDESTFSIDLGEARICFTQPRALFDAEDCTGLGPDPVPAFAGTDPRLRRIAAGAIRVPGSRTSPRILGFVEAMRVETTNATRPSTAGLTTFADGLTKGIARELPAPAVARVLCSRLVVKDDVAIARVTVAIEGVPASLQGEELVTHLEYVTVFASDTTYALLWKGPKSSATALARAADAAAATVQLSPARRPPERASAAAMIRLAAPIGLPALVIGLVLVLRRRTQRSEPEWPSIRPNRISVRRDAA